MPPFTVVIPVRYDSARLPGKPLLEIVGKPMIQHVWERAVASGARRVVVAVDDPRVEAAARRFGAETCMTAATCRSGTERLAEAAQRCGLDADEIVVNLQGDEPLLPPALIDQVAGALAQRSNASIAAMATLAEPIATMRELLDPNAVKVVIDRQGCALYFSRAPIPWDRDQFAPPGGAADAELAHGRHLRHIGLYAYRVGFLRRYVAWPPAPLEQTESLEQLRALWNGARIHVAIACEPASVGVDTAADLEKARRLLDGAATQKCGD